MNKVALVTGSSRGIGRAIALELAVQGYQVIVHGKTNSPALRSTLKVVKKYSPSSLSVSFDVSDTLSVEQGIKAITKDTTEVSVLVNNAGISQDFPFTKMTYHAWQSVIQTNLNGPFYVTKAILPLMLKAQYGRIINMSSVAGERGAYGKTNYAAAKAGLVGFTKSLAQEVAKDGITVNAVCPAWIKTELSHSIPEKYRHQALSQIALKRFGTPKEVANLVTFLASEGSAYITGSVFDIQGGLA